MPKIIKILVCGGRNYSNYEAIKYCLTKFEEEAKASKVLDCGEIHLIHGAAPGADSIARMVAEKLGWKITAFPANWDKHGKAAGLIRNQQMLDEGGPNIVYAFHSDLKSSKGTLDMVLRANKAGLPVRLYP